MIKLIRSITILAAIFIAATSQSYAQPVQTTGMRFGLGTDASGGLAYGVEVNILKEKEGNGIEMGAMLFGGKFEEDTNNGFNDYHEETEVVVVAVLANYLLQYDPVKSAYFVFGFGVGLISVSWMESSLTDMSLGTPLPGGGTFQEEDASAAGTILNIGVGYRFNDKTDFRVQVPTIVILGGPERASSTIPLLSVTMGIRF